MTKPLLMLFLLIFGNSLGGGSETAGRDLTLRMFVQSPDVCLQQKSLAAELEITNAGQSGVNIGKISSTSVEFEALPDPRNDDFTYSSNVQIQDAFSSPSRDLVLPAGKTDRRKFVVRMEEKTVETAGFYQVRIRQTFSRKTSSDVHTTRLESNWIILRVQPCS
jgi:hypothetical protein